LRRRRALVVFATLAICSACAGSGSSASPSPSPTPAASATPSASPSPAAITFKLNGVRANASGTITLTAAPGQMTVRLKITSLQANSSHISHIHIGSCQQNGNIALALNQVIADAQGDADVKTTVKATYPPANGTWYVVVHAGPDMQGSNSSYLLCGNLFA
jgi:Cu/Zn superoxide dismutase